MARIDLTVIADACTLAPDQLAVRQRELRRELLPAVLAQRRTEAGLELEFDAGLRARLEDLVAFEERCCPGLGWAVVDGEEAGRVRLVIAGA